NALIKSGARLITSVDDIFDELPRLRGEVIVRRVTQRPEITDSEKAIMNLFSSGPMQIDQISRAMEKPTGELMELLLALELKGVLTEISGKRFVLSEEFAR
ncbi:MAG: DNA-protecting protein DprA, partial [Candidatus Zixiibacteriota bacterium]